MALHPLLTKRGAAAFNRDQLWAQVESSHGFSLAAKQTWRLLTTNKSGIALRQRGIALGSELRYGNGD
jgi:hypothetical protein